MQTKPIEVEATAGEAPSSGFGSFLNAGVAMRNRDQQAATGFMRAAIRQIDFSQRSPVHMDGGWNVYIDDCLSLGWVSVDFTAMSIIFGTDTWEQLQLSPPIRERVMHDLREGASGLKMLSADTVSQLARIQQLGIKKEDEVVRLEKLARDLIREAASINNQSGVSAQEIAQFTLRSSQLQGAYDTLWRRVIALKALVDDSVGAVEAAL